MRATLLRWAAAHDAVITREQALRLARPWVLTRSVTAGALVRVAPEVFVLAERQSDERTLDAAALAYGGRGAALSHVTALRRWGHRLPDTGPRHVTTDRQRQLRGVPGAITVHRVDDFVTGAPHTYEINGLRLVGVEDALVTSWPSLTTDQRLPILVNLLRTRRTTAALLGDAVARHPFVRGGAECLRLAGLVATGCHSWLEVYGQSGVFDHPSLPSAVLQHRVRVGGRSYVLDRAYLAQKVAVELDGAAFHGSREQREADLRRDAALAASGWLVVRFSYARLVADPAGCREELRRILAVRQA